MSKTILLTSFQTWLPHQQSNASDDLLGEMQKQDFSTASLSFLRQLPVDVPQASHRVIADIKALQPERIICCGMAESYHKLGIEANATCQEKLLRTSVDLEKLVAEFSFTEISHNAGKFVCEGLYYEILNFLQESHSTSQCIFVHIPVITDENFPKVVEDFELMIEKIASLAI
ncbi:MAG: peptidase C15 [Cyanobacteria bacterium SW_10_48_33]|nr:MAG: peptidase C15 [Cyanobacteria bacterium QS_5_48_63]PSP10940.1 MAG: peptidase C15 [Cyanobacteria bacterium SW_10_48_33]